MPTMRYDRTNGFGETEVRYEWKRWSHLTGKEKLRVAGKRALAAATAGLVLMFTFGDSYIDLAGDLNKQQTEDEMLSEAKGKFSRKYANSSATGQLALAYTGFSGARIRVNERGDDGNGLLGIFYGKDKFYNFGQSCLSGSGYDFTASEIRVNGIFVRGGGDINANAVVNTAENGDVTIYPTTDTGEPLVFKEEDGIYKSGNESTTRTLSTYGCDTEYNPLTDGPISVYVE